MQPDYVPCPLQSYLAKHAIKNTSSGPGDRDVQATRHSPFVVHEASKHPKLFSSVRRVNVLTCLCFAKREFAGSRRDAIRVRSYATKVRRARKGVPEPSLGYGTVAASHKKSIGCHLAGNPKNQRLVRRRRHGVMRLGARVPLPPGRGTTHLEGLQ
jgi:hypothetical protein